ncbi:MAG: hypothetical protein J7647_32555 [Cyanobacteria bacterium SBLK]|nr:hypothetical protein [Cyanobacteria bacterium SBLK]
MAGNKSTFAKGAGAASLSGSSAISEAEQIAAGIDDPKNLTSAEAARINEIRGNGYSLSEKNDLDRGRENDRTIYKGERVVAYVNHTGEVLFTVDGSAYSSQGTPPTRELKNMKRAIRNYEESPAGKRLFWNAPVGGAEGTRAKIYRRSGYKDVRGVKNEDGVQIQVKDNRTRSQKRKNPLSASNVQELVNIGDFEADIY